MELTTLENYVLQKQIEYYSDYAERGKRPLEPFTAEAQVWAIQDYYSMKGEFSEADEKYLEKLGYFVDDFADHYEVWKDSNNNTVWVCHDLNEAEITYAELICNGEKASLVLVSADGSLIDTIKSNVQEV